jgi:AraC-like DNA-binding protein
VPTLKPEKHIEAELDKRIQRVGEPFVRWVTRVIEVQLSSCLVSQSATAKQLGMGTRTLQRKLTEHGVTYQALVDQVRRTLGEELLRDAFALGYGDAGGFNRAWRQWTGHSPRAFRNQARGVVSPHRSKALERPWAS